MGGAGERNVRGGEEREEMEATGGRTPTRRRDPSSNYNIETTAHEVFVNGCQWVERRRRNGGGRSIIVKGENVRREG